MRHAKAFVFAAIAGVLAASSLEAQTAAGSVRWMGVNGAWGSYSNFPDGSGTRWNVYTSPYRAQFSIPSDVPHDWHLPVNGGSTFGPTQDIFCVDFNHYANTGTYSALFTNLGTSSGFVGVYTRGSSLQTYLAAAYLAQEVKLHPSQAGILNGAIWQIMSGQPNYWWNGSAWADVAPTAAYALNTGYKSVRASEWVVVTDGFVDATHDRVVLGNSQEYITHVTPEPATLLLLGTGLVVLLMAAGAFRKPSA